MHPVPEHIISRKKRLYNSFTAYNTYRIGINNYLHLDRPNYLQHLSSHHGAGHPKYNKQGYGQLHYLSITQILLRILCKSSNFTGSDEEFTSFITSAPRSGTTKFPVLRAMSKNLIRIKENGNVILGHFFFVIKVLLNLFEVILQ